MRILSNIQRSILAPPRLAVLEMKSLSRALFVAYLLVLLWLVLFKLSVDIPSVLRHSIRSLNLIPFAHLSAGGVRDLVSNIVVFIPFGVSLGLNVKQATFRQKFACILIFSLAVEIIQYILAIGITDTTDVLTNTFGGFLGLTFYEASRKYMDSEKLDRFINVIGAIVFILSLLLRFFVLRVRY